MNKLFILLIIITFLKVDAQVTIDVIDTLNYKPASGLREYYTNINNAELAIIEKEYLKASQLYYKAFEYKVPFMQDLQNSNNIDKKLPFDSVRFQNQLVLWRRISTNYNSTKEYLNFIVKFYPNIDSNIILSYYPVIDTVKNISKLNKKLIAKVDSLEQKDQYIRKNKVTSQEFRSTDTSDYYSLLKLFSDYKINENTIKKKGIYSIDLILLHASRYGFTEWIPIIYKEVMKGNYSNRRFAALLDSYLQNNFSTNLDSSAYAYISGFALYDKYVIPKNELTAKNLEKINKRRNILMLDNYKNQQKKQIWNFRNSNKITFYEYFSYIFVFPEASEQEKTEAKKEQEQILSNIKKKYNDLLIFNKDSDNYDINL